MLSWRSPSRSRTFARCALPSSARTPAAAAADVPAARPLAAPDALAPPATRGVDGTDEPAAVRGVESIGGHKAGYGGVNVVDRGGTNHWRPGTGSRQSYLALRGDKHWREIDADIAAGRPPPPVEAAGPSDGRPGWALAGWRRPPPSPALTTTWTRMMRSRRARRAARGAVRGR